MQQTDTDTEDADHEISVAYDSHKDSSSTKPLRLLRICNSRSSSHVYFEF